MGPLDLGTLGLLDLFPPQQPPHTFSYLLLTPPVSSSMVWFGKGGRGGRYLDVLFEFRQWRLRLEMDL